MKGLQLHLHANEVAHVVDGLASTLVCRLKALAQPVQRLLAQVDVNTFCVLLPPIHIP